MSSAIPDNEINQIAGYVEAVHQMYNSAYFGREENQPILKFQLSTDGARSESLTIADDHELQAVLFPFRRIWLQSEAIHINKVHKTLGKYATQSTRNWLKVGIDMFKHAADHFDEGVDLHLGRTVRLGDHITPRKLIDLFLNTKYAHFESTRHATKRSQLDNLYDEVGVEYVVWVFQISLHLIFHAYRHTCDAAQSFLCWCYKDYNQIPTITIDTPYKCLFGWMRPEEHSINRHSFNRSDEQSGIAQLARSTLRRKRFQRIYDVLQAIGCNSWNDNEWRDNLLPQNIQCVLERHYDEITVENGEPQFENLPYDDYGKIELQYQYDLETRRQGWHYSVSKHRIWLGGDEIAILNNQYSAIKDIIFNCDAQEPWINHPDSYTWRLPDRNP